MNVNPTRARFLGAIGDRVDAAAVEEIHLFQPIRQGGIESGVAVVAVNERNRAEGAAEHETGERSEPAENVERAERETGERSEPAGNGESAENEMRHTVYTATYRLTLKGPERGKWEFAMHAEADAPLVTVDAVVRGVQRRSGDVEDAEKLEGAEFRALLETIHAETPPAPAPKS